MLVDCATLSAMSAALTINLKRRINCEPSRVLIFVMLINTLTLQVSAQSHHHHQQQQQHRSNNSLNAASLQAAPSSQSEHFVQPFGGSQSVALNRHNQNNNEDELMFAHNQPAAVEVDVDGRPPLSDTSTSSGGVDDESALTSDEEFDSSDQETTGDVPAVASDEDDATARPPLASTTETSVHPYESSGVHLRPSRQSHVITQSQSTLPPTPSPASIPTTTTTQQSLATTLRTIGGAASRQNATPAPATRAPPPRGALDVNMGADMMLIKPAITWADATTTMATTPVSLSDIDRLAAFQARHNQLANKQQPSIDLLNSLASSPVPLTSSSSSSATSRRQMQATTFASTQQPGHELAVESVNHQQIHRPDPSAGAPPQINERRQDVVYPHAYQHPNSFNNNNINENNLDNSDNQLFNSPAAAAAHNHQYQNTCYTPNSLIIVIITTMLITIALCLGARQLFKYLSRHQFDLVENRKHFQPTTTTTSRHNSQPLNSTTLSGANGCSLHLFQRHAQCQKCQSFNQPAQQPPASAALRYGQAFRNPYFTDCSAEQQQQHHNNPLVSHSHDDVGLLTTTTTKVAGIDGAHHHQDAANEQMNFIENHIAQLHSRQVTSSVKELSILSGQVNNLPPTQQVVDLTSQEQRARVLANPREGDLIAVDISGHDIIGLGFDLCGSQREGIFVRSVLARGPARESGAIEPGDKLKCLNVSFEQVTLQDACDLMNTAGPYKMRLLIEKKAISGLELKQLNSSNGNSQLISDAPASPLDATRAYLRKLTGKLAGNESFGLASMSSESPASQAVVPPPIGSAGARALRHSRRVLRNAEPPSTSQEDGERCHVNEAFSLGSPAVDDVSERVGGQGDARHVRKQSEGMRRKSTTTTSGRAYKLRGPSMGGANSETVNDLRQLGTQDVDEMLNLSIVSDDDNDDDNNKQQQRRTQSVTNQINEQSMSSSSNHHDQGQVTTTKPNNMELSSVGQDNEH